MNRITRIRKGFEQAGEIVLKIQKRMETVEKEFRKWLDENGIEAKDFEGVVEELSQNLYENTKEIADHNSKFGWTLAGAMDPFIYIDDQLLGKSKEELDAHFYNYYSEEDWNSYKVLKKDIVGRIDPKWNELIDDCFFLFENDRYKSAIPVLFSVIEGELGTTLDSDEVGTRLVRDMKRAAKGEEARFRKVVLYSIVKCFDKGLFVRNEFKDERKPVINRHWVSHGRDNPNLWEEVDFLRLITVLNSIQFVQEMAEEEKTS
ncbi:hypothetical protein [Planococcus wigleyi]|uniref:DUF4145 domain-containing protein n=1 Tax=Planococcus wigleyi TaxID=2762216 RepID=A0ABR8WDE1_9BACL|nr:hypothetical protein [Planococcus wigleyi]MBD8015053.1 hypothetical protein [Planococcus wigleyi]